MFSLKKNKRGFTIVELLIVIVVIGILAALVVVTYNGIQQKARNTERQTDINAIHGQVEAYQAENGKYPSLSQMNNVSPDTTFRADNLKGLDAAAIQDPKWATAVTQCTAGGVPTLASAAHDDCYSYVATPSGCDNSATDCTGYTLTAKLENGEADYIKKSLN